MSPFLESRCLFCAMYNSNSSVDFITLNIQITTFTEIFFQHVLLRISPGRSLNNSTRQKISSVFQLKSLRLVIKVTNKKMSVATFYEDKSSSSVISIQSRTKWEQPSVCSQNFPECFWGELSYFFEGFFPFLWPCCRDIVESHLRKRATPFLVRVVVTALVWAALPLGLQKHHHIQVLGNFGDGASSVINVK